MKKNLISMLFTICFVILLFPIKVYAEGLTWEEIMAIINNVEQNVTTSGWVYYYESNTIVINAGTSVSGENVISQSIINNGTINGGTFNNEVTNNGKIGDGNFNGLVVNDAEIVGGVFYGNVVNGRANENSSLISGGEFNGNVENNSQIIGGLFSGSVNNNGSITGATIIEPGNNDNDNPSDITTEDDTNTEDEEPNENTEDNSVTIENTNDDSNNTHIHDFQWILTQEPTDRTDGCSSYMCLGLSLLPLLGTILESIKDSSIGLPSTC